MKGHAQIPLTQEKDESTIFSSPRFQEEKPASSSGREVHLVFRKSSSPLLQYLADLPTTPIDILQLNHSHLVVGLFTETDSLPIPRETSYLCDSYINIDNLATVSFESSIFTI